MAKLEQTQSHQHHLSRVDYKQERYREIRNVTLVGSVVDLLLGVSKIIGGVFGHSESLLADGVHSLSDLATDFIVLFAVKHSHKEADEEHPYGHARIETLATILLGIGLFVIAALIVRDALVSIIKPEDLLLPEAWAMSIAFVSILLKEGIYHYTMVTARKFNSALLKANAWHSRSDAISSIVVVIGIGGSLLGFTDFDAIAAIIVAVMIAKLAWELIAKSAMELIDTGLEPKVVNAINDAILKVDGVKSLHVLRTRRMGSEALVDVHIQVAPYLSVSEGHYIGESVRRRIMLSFEEIVDVMVHIDPENDEVHSVNLDLPTRSEVLKMLKARWSSVEGVFSLKPKDIRLNYLEGKLQVELVLPSSLLENMPHNVMERIRVQLDEVAKQIAEVDRIDVYFH